MSALLERLREESQQLDSGERLALGEELLAESDPGAEAAWDEEIIRRVEEIKSGRVKMIPFDAAMRRLRAKHRCPAI